MSYSEKQELLQLLSEKRRRDNRERWAEDPVAYFRERLGMYVWEDFENALRKIKPGARVCVISGNGVGKTEFAAGLVHWHHECFDGMELTTGSSWTSLQKLLWPRIHKYIQQVGMYFDETVTDLQIKGSDPEHRAFAKSPAVPEAIAGAHSEHLMQVVEEASGIEQRIADAIDGNDTGAFGIQVWIGNPLNPEGPFYERSTGGQFIVVQINALRHPNVIEGREVIPGAVTRKSIEDKANGWCQRCESNTPGAVHLFWLGDAGWFIPDARFESRVMGIFPSESEGSLLRSEAIECAMNNRVELTTERALGADIARFGADDTVISEATTNGIYAISKSHGRRTTETAGTITARWKELKGEGMNLAVAVDDGGLGGGVSDALKENQVPTHEVQFGAASQKPEAYVNLKAQMYWEWKEEVENNPFYFLPKNADLLREATTVRWTRDSKGRIQIESKREYKERTGRSPDTLESVLLAFYALQRGQATGKIASAYTDAYKKRMEAERLRQRRGGFPR